MESDVPPYKSTPLKLQTPLLLYVFGHPHQVLTAEKRILTSKQPRGQLTSGGVLHFYEWADSILETSRKR